MHTYTTEEIDVTFSLVLSVSCDFTLYQDDRARLEKERNIIIYSGSASNTIICTNFQTKIAIIITH